MPHPLERLRRRLRALVGRRAADRELDAELRFHLEMETEHNVRAGMDAAAARVKALREFGGVARVRDDARDVRGLGAVEDVVRDLRHAVRSLRRTPGYAAVALLTLALGIGVTTAVYSAVHAVLLRPLPYPAPHELVALQERTANGGAEHFAAANVRDVQAATRTLAAVAYYRAGPSTVLGAQEPVRTHAAGISREFFEVLGASPHVGRGPAPDEGGAGGPHVAVVSYRFWQDALGGRPLAGQTLTVWRDTYQVVGVMPPGFDFPSGTDVWYTTFDDTPSRTAHNWSVVARRTPGASDAQVRAELDALFARLAREHGDDVSAEGVHVAPLQESLAGETRRPLLVLFGAVGLVLLVACINLAGANLARGEARRRELALRTALGAARGRLVRQLLVENLLLALVGGAAGVGVALALTRAIGVLGAGALPEFATLRVDGGVLAFAVAASLLTGVLVGLAPALRSTRALGAEVARGGRAGIDRGGRLLGRGLLVSAEVALALTLLVGAGLLMRSLRALLDVDPGFRAERVLLADVSVPASRYPSDDTLRLARMVDDMLTAARTLPGVETAGLVNRAPLGGAGWLNSGFMADGGSEIAGSADYRVVDEHYLATLGIPVLRGRGPSAADRPGALPVVVVNRAFAERYWPDDPLGHTVRLPGMDAHPDVWMTIVGVVGDVRDAGLDAPVRPAMFIPYRQRPERLVGGLTIAVRAAGDPAPLAGPLRAALRAVEPSAPVELGTLEGLVASSVAERRFATVLLTAFAALALLLAALGVYATLSYAVARRSRELGVRMALGAQRGAVRRMVLRDAMRAVLPGVAAGLFGAWALSRVLRGLLYGVSATDPATFAGVSALLVGVALLASYLPARRATRADPLVAMRAE